MHFVERNDVTGCLLLTTDM